MSNYLIQEETLINIANNIRILTDKTETLTPSNMIELLSGLSTAPVLTKVGSINIERDYTTFDLSAYPELTDENILLVPTSIILAQTKTTTTSETAVFERTFTDGILTIRREAFDGNVTVTLPCDIYIYI